MIALQTVLKELQECYLGQSDKCVTIEYLKINRTQKTGGEIITVARAQKHGLRAQTGYKFMIGIYDHDTGRKSPVHERLILKYNGQEVYW